MPQNAVHNSVQMLAPVGADAERRSCLHHQYTPLFPIVKLTFASEISS